MKNAFVVVLIIAAIGLITYTVVKERRRAQGKISVREAFESGQVAREVYCDACGKISDGLTIKRAFSQQYHKCPECGEQMARPIVYYLCQNPGCNKALVKVRSVVVVEGRPVGGDATVCPVCGREDGVTPMEIELESARKIAEETGQEFP